MLKVLLSIFLIVASLYFFRKRRKRSKNNRKLDLTGKNHKWNELDKDKTYHCAVSFQNICDDSLQYFYSKRSIN